MYLGFDANLVGGAELNLKQDWWAAVHSGVPEAMDQLYSLLA